MSSSLFRREEEEEEEEMEEKRGRRWSYRVWRNGLFDWGKIDDDGSDVKAGVEFDTFERIWRSVACRLRSLFQLLGNLLNSYRSFLTTCRPATEIMFIRNVPEMLKLSNP
ncbi:hypothetical protein TcasGA2_TC005221 [Tribolium castaneum]|uniref:Uncharacterized protein n=1 Tax=Tribolium castaneum TaxID=7070 RepID=D6X1J4_TRICA|nr:hypothetical protein TcasGA2_TC005221 [Tribolium castaneum]